MGVSIYEKKTHFYIVMSTNGGRVDITSTFSRQVLTEAEREREQ